MAHQSLYRRYRPQRFGEIRGQHHVRQALQTAVREGRWSHAYLFSGPRGTGKTSTARVLAKALNCEDLGPDGEPCGSCESCVAIEQGRSFDLHELDAASHNKVDDIRDLISKVHLGSPGRTKVYILDEVHMLTAGAENALLKTLEEPPDHVVFVLATTEAHKVVPTIRSRTQHFEFQLLPGDELADHVRWVIADAGLAVDDDGVEYVLRSGGGSARDTLSALDLVSAAGGVPASSSVGVELARAIGAGDTGGALTAVQRALEAGREPRTIAEEALAHLRDAFLASMGAGLAHLSDAQATEARTSGAALSPATLTRALEAVGAAVVEMRQSPDPRVPLEVTLLRLTRRTGTDPAALVQRIEALEAEVAALRAAAVTATPATSPARSEGPAPSSAPVAVEPPSTTTPAPLPDAGAPAPPPAPTPAPAPAAATTAQAGPAAAPTEGRRAGRPADAARRTLGGSDPGASRPGSSSRSRPADRPPPASPPARPPAGPRASRGPRNAPPPPTAPVPPATAAAQAPPAAVAATSPPAGGADVAALALGLDGLEAAWRASVLDGLSRTARARYKVGRFLGLDGTSVRFALPNAIHRDRCADLRAEVEAALVAALGHPLTLVLEVDTASADSGRSSYGGSTTDRDAPFADEDVGDVTELTNADDVASSGIERLTRAFPGSKVITSED